MEVLEVLPFSKSGKDGIPGVSRGSKRHIEKRLLSALKECIHSKDLERGRSVHWQAIHTGLYSSRYVVNTLINMYGKCGSTSDARKVFDSSLCPRDAVSWTCLLWGYVENGESQTALELFDTIVGEIEPDARMYVAVITACAALASEDPKRWLEKGKFIHFQVFVKKVRDIYVETALVDMYAKCRCMPEARGVFESMPLRNVVSWTALLMGYAVNGESELALELFDKMEETGCVPTSRTYVAVITACATLAADDGENRRKWLEKGRVFHFQALISCNCDMFVENTLVDMYAKCSSITRARRVFDEMVYTDIVSWNSVLQGYVDNEENKLALKLFEELECYGCVPDARTYVALLSAYSVLASSSPCKLRWLEKAKAVRAQVKATRSCNIFVENTLMTLFAKCGCMREAQHVFDGMVRKDVVAWNALLTGYVENGENKYALKYLAYMDLSNMEANALTFLAAFTACANLADIRLGQELHNDVLHGGMQQEIMVASALVDFYGKVGLMNKAKQVFDSVHIRTVWLWNVLMCGYSLHGDTECVLELFEDMKKQGTEPNGISFLCIFSACGHAGLTDKGKECFDEMKLKYGITPTLQHYNSIIDMYARANYLDEAMRIAKSMPYEPDVVTWTAVLGACRKWNNVVIGMVAYDSLVRLDEKVAAAYVSMASIYSDTPRKT